MTNAKLWSLLAFRVTLIPAFIWSVSNSVHITSIATVLEIVTFDWNCVTKENTVKFTQWFRELFHEFCFSRYLRYLPLGKLWSCTKVKNISFSIWIPAFSASGQCFYFLSIFLFCSVFMEKLEVLSTSLNITLAWHTVALNSSSAFMFLSKISAVASAFFLQLHVISSFNACLKMKKNFCLCFVATYNYFI